MRSGRFIRASLPAAGLMLMLQTSAIADVKLIDDSVIDARATTMSSQATFGRSINGLSFQGQALTSFNGYQYAIYWVTDAATAPEAHVAVARRKLPAGAWQVIDLRASVFKNGVIKGTNEPNDAHNTCSIGICPNDGSIHIAYDHHVNPLRYRVTAPGAATEPEKIEWNEAIFAPERDNLASGRPIDQVSYPDFEATPGGDLQCFMRIGGSGHGSWSVWNYDGKAHHWTDGWQYDDGFVGSYDKITPPSNERSAYPNGWTYGPDGRLHTTFVWREGGGRPVVYPISNHDICYAWSADGGVTWKNSAGEMIGDRQAAGAKRYFSIMSPGLTVIPTSGFESLMNTQGQAVDSQGRIHTLMYRLDSAKATAKPGDPVWQTANCSYFHNWRDDDGTWRENKLPITVGNRPKLVFDKADNAYAIVANGPTPGIRAIDRQLVIAVATKAAGWSDWKIAATVPGPFLSEPQIDLARMQRDGILSVVMQESPTAERQPTKIHVYDFSTLER